ncbi:DUF397 domain-containing protein [Streptomyces griseus]|uniref:DUF397 domain-containing protein n=1 Tax=Streptomyces sp. CMC78 TaxID=3231512 RepID=A0AB33KJF0_9ACTN|nr:DUF397 domain-containing protein [Streptomyces sp. ID01-9D]MDX5572966.1 DUF397 domain-containing protein [Streptomyces sp. ID01-9D]WSV24216.1 DUF397 domain-containing protein [Streptomyces fimicarius]WTC86874.1 DUF397 domain-containing protein [Streptomyces griseus]WTD70506.1 DUF397 domain-containing protein [Streptomyces griseus]
MNRAALPVSRSADLHWFKSSYSSDQGGNCVEVATHPAAVHIRDSKVTDGPVLTVEPAAWSAFVHGSSASL